MKNVHYLLLVLMLSGCGFRLMGSLPLPPVLAKIMVKIESVPGTLPSDLLPVLRGKLEAKGVELTDKTDRATAILVVGDEQWQLQTLARGPENRVQDYDYSYTLDYRLLTPEGKTLLPKKQLTETRGVLYSQAELLGTSQGLKIIRQELLAAMADSIIRRLERLNVSGS